MKFKRLKDLREERDIKQYELAKILNIYKGAYNQYETEYMYIFTSDDFDGKLIEYNTEQPENIPHMSVTRSVLNLDKSSVFNALQP